MKLKLKQLDKRNTGHDIWKYYIQVSVNNKNGRTDFCNVREWCWSHWGPSKELDAYDHNDLFDGFNCSNSRWCWQHDQYRTRSGTILIDQYRTRIYLLGDEELLAFSLKWF